MTAPAAPQQPQPVVVQHPAFTPSVVRAIISALETAGFVIAAVLYALNNGGDSHNAVVTALSAAVLHGVNHNAGGSPI